MILELEIDISPTFIVELVMCNYGQKILFTSTPRAQMIYDHLSERFLLTNVDSLPNILEK